MGAEEYLTVPLHLPLEWRPLNTVVEMAEGSLAQASLRVLNLAMTLSERSSTLSEESTGLELEVFNLQRRVQLLTELLAQATIANLQQPARVDVALSAASVEWIATDAILGTGLVALWLHPVVAEPLLLPAKITAVTAAPAARFRVTAQLLPISEASEAALDRYIFQQHRRAVAEARLERRQRYA